MAAIGQGPPLLRTAHWLSHVEHDARSPVWTHWLDALSRGHTFIRYDQRGCGLSDWSPPSTSFEAWIDDLEAVVEANGLTRFPLFGMSQGGAIAIAYAARHPEKVSHLVLFGAYARGMLRREITPPQREEAETLVKLIRLGWGRDNPAFRQVFTSQFIPEGTHEQHQWFNDLERLSASPENAATIVETLYGLDVAGEAERIRVPTLVLLRAMMRASRSKRGGGWPDSFRPPASSRWKAAITSSCRRSLPGRSSSRSFAASLAAAQLQPIPWRRRD